MELQEQTCTLAIIGQFGIGDTRLHLECVKQLDTSQRNAQLQDNLHRGGGMRQFLKLHAGSCNGFGNAEQPQLHLGDDPKRAFAPHIKAGEVIACRRFSGPPPRFDHCALRRHHGQTKRNVAHGAIADGIRA